MPTTPPAAHFRELEPIWASTRILVGPLTEMWQADLWARKVLTKLDGCAAHTFDYVDATHDSGADLVIDRSQGSDGSSETNSLRTFAQLNYTHVLCRCSDAVVGDPEFTPAKLALFVSAKDVGVDAASPLREPMTPGEQLTEQAEATLQRVKGFSGPVLVAQISLLPTLPQARWCPLVVELAKSNPPRMFKAGEPPVVLVASADTESRLSDSGDESLRSLEERGIIRLRVVHSADIAALRVAIRESHIVVDLDSAGDYGMVACQSMALGRVVLGNVGPAARDALSQATGRSVPILDASAASLAELLERFAQNPAEAQTIGKAGISYAKQVHGGALTLAAVADFTGSEPVAASLDRTPHDSPVVDSASEKTRGRIVMLVDNDVVRDSRVQKQARSAAERGWEVFLIGITQKPNGTTMRWTVGDAKVRLLLKTSHLKPTRRRRSPAPLTSFVAFRSRRHEEHARALVDAHRRAMQHDRAVLSGAIAATGEPTFPVSGWSMPARRAAFYLRRQTYAARANAGERLGRLTEEGSISSELATKFWLRVLGDRAWSRLDPTIHEWDLVFADAIDRLRPDIIHANDFRMLGVGARAKTRAATQGRRIALVWDAHEYLPGIKPDAVPSPKDLALCAFERENIPFADRVITVSETLADMLVRDHNLQSRPYVVENAPIVHNAAAGAPVATGSDRDLRQDCGLASEVPLMVYCGGATAMRGLETIVRGLPLLPGVHAALVVSDLNLPFVTFLTDLAEDLGVPNRLHVVTYVPVDHIVTYLSGADIGLVSAHHVPNHEISLPTKFREYAHAHLAFVVSDVRTVAEIVRKYGIGEVFVAGDENSFADAVRLVIADKHSYRWRLNYPGLLSSWTWDAAADVLDHVYSSLEPLELSSQRSSGT